MEEAYAESPVLVTGCAGFIGMHLTARLLDRDREVVGVDLLTDDYDRDLKRARLDRLRERSGFSFERADVRNRSRMEEIARTHLPARLVHLAARAGVRSSGGESGGYVSHNVRGTDSVLSVSRTIEIDHVVLASSSSVYGDSVPDRPTPETARIDAPRSIYAATKGAAELIGHAHARIGSVPVTAARLFTVYGPWGRPDMAYFVFTRALERRESVPLFDRGRMVRDMTFVDDAVEALVRLLDTPPPSMQEEETVPYRAVNVGTGRIVTVAAMLETLESLVGRTGDRAHLPAPDEDVPKTWARTDRLDRLVGFVPETGLEEGLRSFVDWYRTWSEASKI